MDDMSRKDIRRILKTFGIQADEALVAHLARNPYVDVLDIRLTLEDVTQYGDSPPEEKLFFVINDQVHRSGASEE